MELDISPLPARTLDSIGEWLWDYVPKDRVVMGGGTILAARWCHRETVDVDLYCEERATFAHPDLLAAGNGEVDASRLAKFDLGPTHLFARTPEGGELCLFLKQQLAEGRLTTPVSWRDTARDLAVYTNQSILDILVRCRIFGVGTLLKEDLYDLAIAAERAEILNQVLGGWFWDKCLFFMREALRKEPLDFNLRPLLSPTEIHLADSSNLRARVRELLTPLVEERQRVMCGID